MPPTAPCIFFLQGRCRKGAGCTFLHEATKAHTPQTAQSWRRPTTAALPLAPSQTNPAVVPPRGAFIPCRFYQAGDCTRGDLCQFAHVKPTTPLVDPVSGEISDNRNGIPVKPSGDSGVEVRVMGATLSVSFGHGLEITSVGSATATSIITIHNLPLDTTAEAARELLMLFDEGLTTDAIRLIPLEDAAYATVKLKDPATAGEVVPALDGMDYHGYRLSVKPYQPKGLSNLSQSSTRVSCSWFAASTVASVTFPTLRQALRAWEATKGKKLHGRTVECKYPTAPRSGPTMSVGNLPPKVTKQDIRKLIPGVESTFIHPPTYEVTPEEVLAHVVSMVQRGPPEVESCEIVTPPNAPKIKAIIRFTSEDAASRAVLRYNGTKLDIIGNGPIYLQAIYTANFKISRDVYRAVSADLAVIGMEHREKVRFSIFGARSMNGSSGNLVTIRLTGQKKSDVAEMKAVVGKVVRGQLTREENGSKQLWDKFFTTTIGINKVNEIAHETKTYIYCDKRKCQVFIFGTQENRDRAIAMLHQTLTSVRENTVHEIPLAGWRWREFIREKLKSFREIFGQEKVNVNIVKRCIEFYGSAEELEQFRAVVGQTGNVGKGKAPASTGIDAPGECPICFDTAEDPVRISLMPGCEHVYCTACLKDYINSAVDTRKFPITCVGTSTADSNALCGARLDLTVATGVLSTGELDNVLHTAFTSYIRRRPNEFLYCPTANCGTVYCPPPTSTKGGQVLTCVDCLLEICMTCNVEAHDGITCEEYKISTHHDQNAEKEYEEWKARNGVQACPKCKTDIQKVSGCNHITCGSCKAHICWQCLAVFNQSEEVYTHMTKEHGGFGLGDWDD
ncbi:hypothetical protein L211DRAFT_791862 [Terfezia boudieri ATCC MYA-4762]|uniref:RBR-type E3 ubiquitin transferase n=1 Tax=Terfezia boudieri ATCC MYA-4762 TaxID=1051890 RepID=A0A3N4LGK9_9PEZI|nr:hypothetical protein L211DRAFT_791862 [Terfezia boudieri ATCC MYA-4762]